MSGTHKNNMKIGRAGGALDNTQRVARTRATAGISIRNFIRTIPEIAGEKGPVNRPEAGFSSEIREDRGLERSRFGAVQAPESCEPLPVNRFARITTFNPARLGNLPPYSEGFPSCHSSLNRLD
jgi:hypothetical protein